MIAAALRRPAAIAARYLLRWTGLRAGVVLVYHHVASAPDSAPQGPVQVTASDDFAAQMRHLRRGYRVVPAREILVATARRRRGARFPVAVTFDDDLPSHAEVAMPILLDLNLPATFFVGGRGLVRAPELWWETLERGLAAGLVDESQTWDIAERLLELEPEQREHWRRVLADRLGEPGEPKCLTRSQLRALAEAGFELGFHTLRHENLLQLEDGQLSVALTEGRDAVAEIGGRPITALSYPYGRADQRVALAARRQGFEVGFTGREACVREDADRMLIGRIEPAPRSTGEFARDLTRRLARAWSRPRGGRSE